MNKCPGQAPNTVKANEIFDADCPACGKPIEFFGSDTVRRCPSCGHSAPNPRLAANAEAPAEEAKA